MSGGVDSSVAAFLLKEQGLEVVGLTMCLGVRDGEDDSRSQCCGAQAIEDAKAVCRQLNIDHYVLDFSDDLEKKVIADFVSEYMSGRTPNPCVRCNEYLKFGKLLRYAKNMGFDFLATGHYARIEKAAEHFLLKKPKDAIKDQTYFLYGIRKEDLPFILFPLADYTKEQVREIARKNKLAVADKPQSQDICFVQDTDYADFIFQRTGQKKEGDIVDSGGNVLGRHKGIFHYTRGQSRGLGIAVGKPLYVVGIDADKNRVVVGDRDDLEAQGLIAEAVNILSQELPPKIWAKIRYGQKEAPCRVKFCKDKTLEVIFDQAQEAISPGQSIVLYDNDIVCGGGIIKKSL